MLSAAVTVWLLASYIPLLLDALPSSEPQSALPPQFSKQEMLARGRLEFIALQFLPDARLLVLDRTGKIWLSNAHGEAGAALELYLELPDTNWGDVSLKSPV